MSGSTQRRTTPSRRHTLAARSNSSSTTGHRCLQLSPQRRYGQAPSGRSCPNRRHHQLLRPLRQSPLLALMPVPSVSLAVAGRYPTRHRARRSLPPCCLQARRVADPPCSLCGSTAQRRCLPPSRVRAVPRARPQPVRRSWTPRDPRQLRPSCRRSTTSQERPQLPEARAP